MLFLHDDKIQSMDELSLPGKTILVTGAARRIGRALALACARAGANIIIHYNESEEEAAELQKEIESLDRRAWMIQADLGKPASIEKLISQAIKAGPIYGLVNNAAIFASLTMQDATLADWERHLAVNLTAPFLLSQAFAKQVPANESGRIVNLLDWRALRPGADHFPYTVSKSALAAMTRSLAIALAPNITVNGLALGAILPPSDKPVNEKILKDIPAKRWGGPKEIADALIFLLAGSAYITGEIIQIDGGRHLI
ncbi:MAG: SDR family oxidoreductase [Chloroflexi bacterium]|nr:SDR family oxidoreductase [Chloroflexota bacterium]